MRFSIQAQRGITYGVHFEGMPRFIIAAEAGQSQPSVSRQASTLHDVIPCTHSRQATQNGVGEDGSADSKQRFEKLKQAGSETLPCI